MKTAVSPTTNHSHQELSRRDDTTRSHSQSWWDASLNYHQHQFKQSTVLWILPIFLLIFLLILRTAITMIRKYYWPWLMLVPRGSHRPITIGFQLPAQEQQRPSEKGTPSCHTSHHPTTATTTKPNMTNTTSTPLTLRQILHDDYNNDDVGFHLALAPAFFGFYGYFGILSAWYDEIAASSASTAATHGPALPIRSVVGASAGAMAAILIAAGISPHDAMTFCANITVDQYADFPGFLALFRGNLFEQLLQDFLISAQQPDETSPASSLLLPILLLEDARTPVAVTAFDIQTMTTQILVKGSMARAARASATFPGLFQPVGWNQNNDEDSTRKDYLFIDGGVLDVAGTMGLKKTMTSHSSNKQRVINLCVGKFHTMPGPSDLPYHPEVISISIIGLPQPGPWAMSNGPIAYDMARTAMKNALDVPLQQMNAAVAAVDDTEQTHSDTCHHHEPPSIPPAHYQLVIKI